MILNINFLVNGEKNMKCPKCNGKYYDRNRWSFICKFCHGKKELDWIEIIFGVDRPEQIWSPDNSGGSWRYELLSSEMKKHRVFDYEMSKM